MRTKGFGAALLATSVVGLTVGLGAVGAATASAPQDSTSGTPTVPTSDGVATVVRKTVLQTGNATGQVSDMSMVTQVSAVGEGTNTIEVPVGTSSVRNLNNFGSPATQGDDVVFPMTVDGNTNRRVYTKADVQPITVVTRATLDGKPVNPASVIDETGVLKVTYVVTNKTTRTVSTTYPNGAGIQVPTTATIADPFVGSLAVTLPSQFGEVTAPGATVAGDGKGGTQLGYQMVLFDPLGSPTQTLTYESRIQGGTIPQATFGFLPIVPYDNSTIASTKDAYASGSASGEKVYDAGLQLGDNLLKLQAGAGKLLAGLGLLTDGAQKLTDGAGKLADGLNGTAIPAANQVAEGSAALSKGLTKELAPGAQQIADGLVTLNQAFIDLPDTVMADAQYQQLVGGVQQLQIGLQGLNQQQGPVLQSFAVQVSEYLNSIKTLAASGDCTSAACPDIVQDATSGLASNLNVQTGLEGIVEQAGTGAAGLVEVQEGIGTLVDSIASNLYENEQWQELLAGGQKLAEGAFDAADGAGQLADGTAKLADGLVPAGEGATALADGGVLLVDGLDKASDGAVQIEDGAGQLKSEGTDKLMESGDQTASDFAQKVAVLNALQAEGQAGAGIPYGNATGANTTTTGAYQLVLSGASSSTTDNIARYTVGIIGFIVAGALGTMLWRRRLTG